MIKLELTEYEVNVILQGLLEIPAKISMDIINNVRKQALPQVETSGEQQQEA